MRHILLFLLVSSLTATDSLAADPFSLSALSSSTDEAGNTTYSLSLQILALMSAITVLPSIVLGMTAFTRIIIVLSILRQALGTQQTPPNQVLIAIALFLTATVMTPTLTRVYDEAVTPYLSERIGPEEAFNIGGSIMKDFLVINTRKESLVMFSDLANSEPFASNAEIPFSVILPAFITSELKTAFQIGFLIFLPFLVIDMVISSILMSLGMMMLSPMLISLPFKLLLFVLVDGWSMMSASLVSTFVTP